MRKPVLSQTTLVFLIVVACVLGCRRDEVRAVVSGKVTFRDEPVTEGVVIFSNAAKGIHLTASLDDQGCYEVMSAEGAGLPPGEYHVAVSPPIFDPPVGASPGSTKIPTFPNIPQKYRDQKTSGLSLTVTEEARTFDIDMKPDSQKQCHCLPKGRRAGRSPNHARRLIGAGRRFPSRTGQGIGKREDGHRHD